jgi:hypothetical protein
LVPNKTIYIKEADTELWEKAERLAGDSVSALLTEALRRYVEEAEQNMETIEVAVGGLPGIPGKTYTAQFVGRWLLHPDYYDEAGGYYGVALTQRGNIVVYLQVDVRFPPSLKVYDSFEGAEAWGVPESILSMAAAEIEADYVQKLDI